jgi:hypothetical protein
LLVHGVTVGIIVVVGDGGIVIGIVVVGVVVVVGDGGIVIGIVVGSSVVVSVKARNKSYFLYTS